MCACLCMSNRKKRAWTRKRFRIHTALEKRACQIVENVSFGFSEICISLSKEEIKMNERTH